MLLKNKIILITGSTTGIGEATARRCMEEGAYVMIHGRNETRAKKLVNEFKSQSDYVIADISNPDNCEKIVAATIKKFGALHAVVNNAASTMRSDISTTEIATFDYLINVNLKAPLLISQAAIHQFRLQGQAAYTGKCC